ncbi:MAG: tetratricopeptide repeat protein [Gemmataceae bacterium]|nr:tetratricopeptide repeat protein [Gemmataceae bacterium]
MKVVFALALAVIIAFCGFKIYQHWQTESHWRAAQSALSKNNLSKARAHLLLFLEDRPGHPEAHLLLARIARRDNDAPEALHQARLAEKTGAVAEAVELERLLLKTQQGDLFPHHSMLLAYVDKAHPESGNILEALTMGYLLAYRLVEARQCTDRWIKLEPERSDPWVMRGKTLELFQNYTEAGENYAKALEIEPDNAYIRLQRAKMHLLLSEPAQAVEHLEFLRNKESDNFEVLQTWSQAKIEAGEPEATRATLELLTRRNPTNADAWTLLGRVEMLALKPKEAEPYLRKAAALVPYEREIVYNLIGCLERQGKKDETAKWQAQFDKINAARKKLQTLKQSIAARPNDPALRLQTGEILLDIGHETEGLRWMHSALQEDPRHRPTHEALSKYYAKAGKDELAQYHARMLK